MIKAMKDFQIPMRVEVDKDTSFPDIRQIYDRGIRARIRHHGWELVTPCVVVFLDGGGGDHRQDRRSATRILNDSWRDRRCDIHHFECEKPSTCLT